MERGHIIGIDLGSKASHLATLKGIKLVELVRLENEDIPGYVSRYRAIVCIDAPLTLPKEGTMRECDRKLISMGIPCFPPLAPFFRKITMEGIRLRRRLEQIGCTVVEVYPYATRVRLRICQYRKKDADGRRKIRKALSEMIEGVPEMLNDHFLDAIISALTGYLMVRGEFERISGADGEIILPRVR